MSLTYPANCGAPGLKPLSPQTGRGITALVEDYAGWLVLGFSVVYWAATYHVASTLRLWNDEIVTRYMVALPQGALIHALKAGADGQPPLFFLLTGLAGSNGSPVGLRLPGMIGMWVAGLCLYVLVSRQTSRTSGVFAMLLPFLLGTRQYATDARPYGLLLGAVALTCVCWQAAADTQPGTPPRRWLVPMLWLAATFTVSISYYGILALVPLGIGEFVRWRHKSAPDLPVWAALAFSAFPLALEFPIVRGLKATLPVFWSQPNLLGSSYQYYQTILEPAAPFAAALLIAALLALYFTRDSPGVSLRLPAAHHIAAVAAFAALPVLYVLVGLYSGAFVPRYAIAGALGICAGLAYVISRHRTLAAICTLLAFAQFATLEARQFRKTIPPRTIDLPQTPGTDSLPVVVSAPNDFIETSYYAAPSLAARLYYIAEPELALHYVNTDVVDLVARRLAQIRPLHVVSYAAFTATHPRFLVLHWREQEFGWLLSKLHDDGATLQLVNLLGDESVYEVIPPRSE